jgi:hypothetical protein
VAAVEWIWDRAYVYGYMFEKVECWVKEKRELRETRGNRRRRREKGRQEDGTGKRGIGAQDGRFESRLQMRIMA